MQKLLIFIFLFISMLFSTEYNDSIVNYIFENRNIFKEYFKDKIYVPESFLVGMVYERETIWQKESLFTVNANIDAYYKYKIDIFYSITNNRNLMKEPAYFNVILPLTKEKENVHMLNLDFFYDVPADILIKYKKKIKELLLFFINRDSQRWNEEQYSGKYDERLYKGYAEYATLAQLDSIYNYKMIPLSDYYVKEILTNCIENYDNFQKRRFITATEFFKIIDTCSNENRKLKKQAIDYIESTTDSGIVHYVNIRYINKGFAIIENGYIPYFFLTIYKTEFITERET